MHSHPSGRRCTQIQQCDAAIRALIHKPSDQIETIDVHQINVKG